MKIVIIFYVSYCHLVSIFDKIKSFNHKNKMRGRELRLTFKNGFNTFWKIIWKKVSKMLVICISNAICIFLFCLHQEKAKRLLEILSKQ